MNPMVRTMLSLLRAWVQSLVGELKSHKPGDKVKINEEILTGLTWMSLEYIMLSEIEYEENTV